MPWETPDPALDPRVRRSRAALMTAAVRLVTERGTTAIPLTDIAAEANVSRQVVYQHFAHRDRLLVETTIDLIRRELIPRLQVEIAVPAPSAYRIAFASAEHFLGHRAFYRALITGSCSYAVSEAIADLYRPFHVRLVHDGLGPDVDPALLEHLVTFLVAGDDALIADYVVNDPEDVEAQEVAARVAAVQKALFPRIVEGR
jgi:AcrR family transcriptional regulator